MNEFYVGYLPKAPSGIARRIRAVVVFLLVSAAIAAIVFAKVQSTFAPSVFEYGKVGTFEGTIEATPYPTLIVAGPGSTEPKASRYLLVAGGIPPVFATNDFNGSPAILLLAGLDQKPLPKESFLKVVARPVRIRGKVVKTGETLYLKIEPSAISSLP